MRLEHRSEVWASNNHTAEQALVLSYILSKKSYTVLKDKCPIFMFGVVPTCEEKKGVVWALGSNDIDNYKKEFCRRSKIYLKELLQIFPYLYNYIDARYTAGIRWLEFLGAEIFPAVEFGVEKMPFHYFEFNRLREV